jgi:hypothetical protein
MSPPMKFGFGHEITYYAIQKGRGHNFFMEFDGLAKPVITSDPSYAYTRMNKRDLDWYIKEYAAHFKGFKVVKIVEKNRKDFEIHKEN